jgi:uncharacterized protein YqiB (DUF1249 family)
LSHTIAQIQQRSPMWVYEKNYAYLVRLLPFLVENDGVVRVRAKHLNAEMEITILEQCPYTQTIQIKQVFTHDSPHLPGLSLKVRIYHDAQLAEVISYQGQSRMLPKYTYPNKKMFHRDEKRQANYLLNDWLATIREIDFSHETEILCPEI